MIQKNVFQWTVAQAILWQIERLKVIHKKEMIDVEFFNQHNTLTPTKLVTLPYFIASATVGFKGFALYGTWVGTEFAENVVTVPEGYDTFVSNLYHNNVGHREFIEKEIPYWNIVPVESLRVSYWDLAPYLKPPDIIKVLKDGEKLHLESFDQFSFEETEEVKILSDGLSFLRAYTKDELLEDSDRGFLFAMWCNSATAVIGMLWNSFKGKPSPGKSFLLSAMSNINARHRFAQDPHMRFH